MQGKWRDSEPVHFLDAPHLKIKYDAMEEFAGGFILYETLKGYSRKYPYEAFFRQEKWNIVFTTGDPDNTHPFSDRDRDARRFREIKGVSRFHRLDIAKDLHLKLCKFRDNILKSESHLRAMTARGQFVQTGRSGDEYWLYENSLIRVQKSPFRDVFISMRLADVSADNIGRYVI